MTVKIVTLGCKVNQAESEALAARLASEGFAVASADTPASEIDRVIVNTCAVTAEAGRKSRQAIRRALGECRDVQVTGCYEKLEPGAVAGTARLTLSSVLPDKPQESGESRLRQPESFSKRQKAYLKIQDGCDNHCTYCVIPQLRGSSRSVPRGEIEHTLERFRASGFQQIVVTGIEIASYGSDCGTNLTELLLGLKRKNPELRFWLGSLEPRWLTAENLQPLTGLIEPEFHISVQSGCGSVLKRMGRRYSAADVLRGIELLRSLFPGCTIGADIIAGFPGESDEEFSATCDFLRTVNLDSLHVFPYSVRPGTPAAEMNPQLPKAVKLARAAELRRLNA